MPPTPPPTPPKNLHLSKTRILGGLQCEKLLHLTVHRPELRTPPGPEAQQRFDTGNQVGDEARKRAPGSGVLIQAEHHDRAGAVAETRAQIEAGALTLFEAGFVHQDVLVRVDVLTRPAQGAPWSIREVKSTVDAKEQHLPDAAIQTWVVRGAGEPVAHTAIQHLNRETRFPGLEDLFVLHDVTETVERDWLPKLPELVARLQKVVSGPEPKTPIGPQCDAPYECPFKAHCWAGIEQPTVLKLPAMSSERKWELLRSGTVRLADVDPQTTPLSPLQLRIVEQTRKAERTVDAAGVARDLGAWEFPLHHLDFETLGPAIPRLTGTRPYQQVPFQFSCHVQASAGAEPVSHFEYLHTSPTDPRPGLAQALTQAIGPAGSVVAYNKAFEAECLKHLAATVPELAGALLGIAARLVDPLPIFRAHVYDPGFAGSFSIKKVAPAILGPKMSYKGLAVASGVEAQLAFDRLIAPATPPDEREAIRRAMLAYCRQDTLAMVKLVDWLFEQGREHAPA